MTRIRIYLEALAFTIQHSVYIFRSEVRRLTDGLPF